MSGEPAGPDLIKQPPSTLERTHLAFGLIWEKHSCGQVGAKWGAQVTRQATRCLEGVYKGVKTPLKGLLKACQKPFRIVLQTFKKGLSETFRRLSKAL